MSPLIWSYPLIVSEIFIFWSCMAASPLQVELVCLGTVDKTSALSLVYYGPAIAAAVDDLNLLEFTGILNFSLAFVYGLYGDDSSFDHADNRLARWYYQNHSSTAKVTVIVTPGRRSNFLICIIGWSTKRRRSTDEFVEKRPAFGLLLFFFSATCNPPPPQRRFWEIVKFLPPFQDFKSSPPPPSKKRSPSSWVIRPNCSFIVLIKVIKVLKILMNCAVQCRNFAWKFLWLIRVPIINIIWPESAIKSNKYATVGPLIFKQRKWWFFTSVASWTHWFDSAAIEEVQCSTSIGACVLLKAHWSKFRFIFSRHVFFCEQWIS